MVNSVYFPIIGNGYLYELKEEPVKPDRSYREYRRCSEEEFKEALSLWKKKHNEWKKVKNEFKLPCSKLLIDRKFEFIQHGINIIFGPNGSGKSTILKAIAGEANCRDGYTTFSNPSDFRNSFNWDDLTEEERFNEKEFLDVLEKVKGNTSVVDYDGYPVYYHNFYQTESNSRGMFGELENSGLINNSEDEIAFILYKTQISSGQKGAWLFNKLVKVVSEEISLEDICEPYKSKINGYNSVWATCYKSQYEHFSNLPNFSKKDKKTLLLDEIDINFDIETVYRLYTEILPRLVNKHNIQIIAVSHNPIVLSKQVTENPVYNVISIDEQYTKDTLNTLRKLEY